MIEQARIVLSALIFIHYWEICIIFARYIVFRKHETDITFCSRSHRNIRFRIWRTDHPKQDTGSSSPIWLHLPGRQRTCALRDPLVRDCLWIHFTGSHQTVRDGMPSRHPGMQYSFGKSPAQHTNEWFAPPRPNASCVGSNPPNRRMHRT